MDDTSEHNNNNSSTSSDKENDGSASAEVIVTYEEDKVDIEIPHFNISRSVHSNLKRRVSRKAVNIGLIHA